MKPQPSNEQEESLEPTFLSDDASPLPYPTFVTRMILPEQYVTKFLATLGSTPSDSPKKEPSVSAISKTCSQPDLSKVMVGCR